ncbi:GNAT family N-acetyltransferase [Naumannella sp. ID2617S]|nr:GNAT family N-acetyltransferase [Naumannella sp. ID2617S]
MDARYRYQTLPLDTPDDDPRWELFLDTFRMGFLDQRPTADTAARYRRTKRDDGATLGMVTTEGPGLREGQPVAAFVSAPYAHNAGAGLVPTTVVNTIAVRPSHRRRGLLSAMMRTHLDAAVERGHATAVLSVSEATIYDRFGFGPATRRTRFELDCRRFRFRPDVALAEGTVEFCEPVLLGEELVRVAQEYAERYRGAHTMLAMHRDESLGAWDHEAEGPSRKLRAVGFWQGERLAGFALYRNDSWDARDTGSITASTVCSPDPAVERRLYQALVEVDLAETVHCFGPGPNAPLAMSLVDPWAVKVTNVGDGVWLRVLDLPKAVGQRGWAGGDGEVTLGVRDRLGYADGTWRVRVGNGRGEAWRTEDAPEVELDVATLGRLHFGDRTVGDCARAGLITGTPEGLARAGRLFAVPETPGNLWHF